MGRRLVSSYFVPAVAAGLLFVAPSARAAGINDYSLTRTFNLPTAVGVSNPTVLIDALADGRLLAVNETQVLRETGVGSGTFTSLGTITGFSPAYGPSFLTVSPDGTRAAVGNNNGRVTVFNTATPATATTYAVGDSEAAWVDNNRLAVSNSSGVQVLNTTTSVVRTVVGNVGGYSGGVAVDASGNLYTANGSDDVAGGTDTGYVKEFSKASWEAAAAGGAALDFETGGTAVADLLSGSSLGFDASGNLHVGGGDFFGTSGDVGYAGLVSAAAVQQALAAGGSVPPITASSPADVLRKFASPADTVTNFQAPIWAYNGVTGELYLRYFQDGQVSVYAVPEPTAMAGIFLAGLAFLRRRRTTIGGVALMAAASSASAYDDSDFAVAVVSSTGLPGTTIYNDPAAVLGRPTLTFNNGTAANPDLRRAKLIEGVFNTGPAGEKLITTFNAGSSLTVRMGHAVTNDPSHPFGIDFNVFGNAFLLPGNTGGFTGDDTNLNTTTVGSVFAENVRVSVSPDNVNWYSYANGPTGDGNYPTNSYRWDRATASWSNDLLDPTKAVDPTLAATLGGKTAADVLDLYNGAAGGAGFDLAESGFASINYVRFDGLTGYNGGEIDAVAAVPEPATLGLAGLLAAGVLRRRTK